MHIFLQSPKFHFYFRLPQSLKSTCLSAHVLQHLVSALIRHNTDNFVRRAIHNEFRARDKICRDNSQMRYLLNLVLFFFFFFSLPWRLTTAKGISVTYSFLRDQEVSIDSCFPLCRMAVICICCTSSNWETFCQYGHFKCIVVNLVDDTQFCGPERVMLLHSMKNSNIATKLQRRWCFASFSFATI